MQAPAHYYGKKQTVSGLKIYWACIDLVYIVVYRYLIKVFVLKQQYI